MRGEGGLEGSNKENLGSKDRPLCDRAIQIGRELWRSLFQLLLKARLVG